MITVAGSKIRFHEKLNIFICCDCVYLRPSSLSDYVSMTADCLPAVLAWILCPEDMEARNWYDCHLLLPINRSESIRFNFYWTRLSFVPPFASVVLVSPLSSHLSAVIWSSPCCANQAIVSIVYKYEYMPPVIEPLSASHSPPGGHFIIAPIHCHKLQCLGRFCGLFIGVSFYFYFSDLNAYRAEEIGANMRMLLDVILSKLVCYDLLFDVKKSMM